MKDLLSWKNYVLHLRSSKLLRIDEIAEEFSGKDVALVGNSRELVSRNLGAQIDDRDIVVRFNNCPMVGEPSHGCRTDWIALSTFIPRRLFVDLRARGVLWFSPRRRKMPAWLAFERRLYLNRRRMAGEILPLATDRPSTGLMMIHLLSTLDPGRVTLFGFDFFKSCSLSGNHSNQTTPHDFSTEERLVHELIERDGRFALCDERSS